MKVRKFVGFTLLIIGCMLYSSVLSAQDINVAKALQAKDYASIDGSLAAELDLCIMDDTQINTKSEAMLRIKSFFNSKEILSILIPFSNSLNSLSCFPKMESSN